MTTCLRGLGGAHLVCVALVASAFALWATACTPQPYTVTREPASLHLVGADSCRDTMGQVAEAYEATYPWVTVTYEVLNNALALDALQEGEADLALLSWRSPGAEDWLWTDTIARDGVAVIVHPGSPFSEISLSELSEIFRGRLQEREGVVITVVSREAGSGTRAAFESKVLEGEGTTLNAVVVPSSDAMVEFVASTPSAIGYVSTRRLDDTVRVLSVEGVEPKERAIATGSYPLWRELRLASKGEPTGEARQFAQWLLRGGGSQGLARGISAASP